MKKKNQKNLIIAVSTFFAFITWTLLLKFIDVKAIGPEQSVVGIASINKFIHRLTGVHMSLYNITDWLGLVPIIVATGFAILGLAQWIKRKNLFKVDYNILVLGGFYIVVILVYLFFEKTVINYRPILINGYLEASYPSSTTMLVMCVMPTAIMQFNLRIKQNALRNFINITIITFIAFMVIGRLISGVHWFTDIIGGALISTSLVMMYYYIVNTKT